MEWISQNSIKFFIVSSDTNLYFLFFINIPICYKYIIRLQSKETRDKLKNRLDANIHYDTPISELPMYKNIEHRKDDITNTQTVCDTILTLPIDPFLTDEEIENTCNIIMATVWVI